MTLSVTLVPSSSSNEYGSCVYRIPVNNRCSADDAPVPPAGAGAAKCRRMPWSWSQRLTEDMAVNAEMGGRLCNVSTVGGIR